VASRLADDSKPSNPLPEGVAPAAPSWWRTTASHLLTWAAYLDRSTDDPAAADQAKILLEGAGRISPLYPSVRYAAAREGSGSGSPPLATSLGQSRDVLSLTWAGRQLLAAGKKDRALAAYRDAVAMAARPDPSRLHAPAFLDDAQLRRYALPSEDLLGAVIGDMASNRQWSYRDWSSVLPSGTAAPVVAARVLRDQGNPDADAALDAALADAETGHVEVAGSGPAEATAEAIRLAAGAEALAMKHRWAEADERYRRAIPKMPVDQVRRSWWLNVADIALRLNEESKRTEALDRAKGADPKDVITVRAVDLQRTSGVVAQRAGGRGRVADTVNP
jgi:hypothetical protein